jgi:hypothetical protein
MATIRRGKGRGWSVERGLRVPLSRWEETALWRVAQGDAWQRDLAPQHLRRLMQLALVLEIDGKLALTPIGHKRSALIQRPPQWTSSK